MDVPSINSLIESGYKPDGYTMIEPYRNWVYCKNGKREHMMHVDSVINYWREDEEKRIAIEKSKTGNTDIDSYFKKYGVLFKCDNNKSFNSTHSTIIYDGKATPGSIWNSEIFKCHASLRIGYNENNYYKKPEYVKRISFEIKHDSESSIDAKVVNGIPKIHHSHSWYDNAHNEYTNHYSHDDWNKLIDDNKTMWIDAVLNCFDAGDINCNGTKTYFSQGNKPYVLWNAGCMEVIQYEISSHGKIRSGSDYAFSSIPKMVKTITKDELREMLTRQADEYTQKSKAYKTFKY